MGTLRTGSRGLLAVVGFIALTVFAALPAAGFTARAVAAEPVVGPELPVSYPLLDTPQYGEQPAVAFGGSVYLVAWQDSDRGVVVARVDRAGTVMDVHGIQLSDRGAAGQPAVAFDGVSFLVVFGGEGGIFAKRVNQEGEVLDDANIQVSSGAGDESDPAIDFDGTNYFVVWSDQLEGRETWGDVYGARVSPDGTVLDPADLPIGTAPGNQSEVDVAFNGTHHLVVWTDFNGWDVYGTLVSPSGTTLNPLGFPISDQVGDQYRASVAPLGTSFVVVWEDGRSGATADVYGSRVDATGTVLDASGIAISAGPEHDGVPQVVSDGTNVLVTFASWREGGAGLHGTRVDSSGGVLDPSDVPLPTSGVESALAFDGDNFFLASWDPDAIRGARVNRNVAVLDPDGITISMGANSQSGPDMAFDGTNTLVVWSDDRSVGDGAGLYGARVGPDGQILDGTGFAIATGAEESYPPTDPSVAFDGTNFLVTWLSNHIIRAARVSPDGDVVDRFDVHVSTDGQLSSPVVAFGEGGYLVAWYSTVYTGSGGYRHDLRAARVGADGVVVDPSGFPITSYSSTSMPGRTDVAFGGSNFMVVWDGPGYPVRTIQGARVVTQDPMPTPELFPISTAEREQSGPRIAWNGETHLVVWQATADLGADIYGARVDDAGTVLDPSGIPLSTAPGNQQTPTVAANGPFLVTWNDRRRGVDIDSDLYATRVDADGTVGHPDGFAVATSIGYYFGSGVPVTPAADEGTFSVGYERFVAGQPYWSNRAFVRHVSPK